MSYFLQKLPTNWNDTPAQGQFNGPNITSPDGEILHIQDSGNISSNYIDVPIVGVGFGIRITAISTNGPSWRINVQLGSGTGFYEYDPISNTWSGGTGSVYTVDFQDNTIIILGRVDAAPLTSADRIFTLWPSFFANTNTQVRFERMMVTDPPIIYDTTPCLTNELRMRIGKKTTGSNAVVNGSFTETSSGDTIATGWRKFDLPKSVVRATNGTESAITYASNRVNIEADPANRKIGGAIYQHNALQRGEEYEISFDTLQCDPGDLIYLRIGDRATPYNASAVKRHTINRKVIDKGDLGIEAHIYSTTDVRVSNIEAYRLTYNTPLKSLPVEFNEGGDYAITEDESIKGMYSRTLNTLTFAGDAYDFIVDYIKDKRFCQLTTLPMIIEVRDTSGNWLKFFECDIVLRTIVQDSDTRTIKADVEDSGIMALINQNKDNNILLGYGLYDSVNDEYINFHSLHRENFLLMVDSTAASRNTARMHTLYDAFDFIINEITGARAAFRSNTFNGLITSNTVDMLAVTNSITGATLENVTQITFKDLFAALHKLFNLTIFVTEPNGVPTVNIESAVAYSYESIIFAREGVQRILRRYNADEPTAILAGVRVTDENFYPPISFLPEAECANGITLDLVVKEVRILDAFIDPTDKTNIFSQFSAVDTLLVQVRKDTDTQEWIREPVSGFYPVYMYPQQRNLYYRGNTVSIAALDDIRNFIFSLAYHASRMPFDVSARIDTEIVRYQPALPDELILQEFQVNMCADEFIELIDVTINNQLIQNPDFRTTQGWTSLGWTISQTATFTSTGTNYLRYLNPVAFGEGQFILMAKTLGDQAIVNGTEIVFKGCNGVFTNLFEIGRFVVQTQPGAVPSFFTFLVNSSFAAFTAIEVELQGTPTGRLEFNWFSLHRCGEITNVQKQFKINSEVGRIKSLTRNMRTGITDITIKTPDTWR